MNPATLWRRSLIACWCALCLPWGCAESGNTPGQAENSAPVAAHPIDEDELIARLSTELRPQATARQDQEHNAIVNYAMDHLLDVQVTGTGLFFHIQKEGSGAVLQWGDPAAAHYKGQFLDGQVFDSSYQRGKPLSFRVGNMIQGWNEGLQLLKPGAKATLLIPSHLGYGETGLTDSNGKVLVPPNSILRFDLELIP